MIQHKAETGGKAIPSAPERAAEGSLPKICFPVSPILARFKRAVPYN